MKIMIITIMRVTENSNDNDIDINNTNILRCCN